MITKKTRIKQSPKLPAKTRREQLLRAAQTLFIKKGFGSTTTEEIARKAGLTKGAIYFHFKNKEDILLELVKSIFEESHQALAEHSDRKLSPVELFELENERHRRCLGAECRDMADIWIQAMRIPRVRQFVTRRIRESINGYADLLDPAFGRTRKERENIVVFVTSLYHGLVAERMVNPKLVDLDSQARLLKKMFARSGRTKVTKKKGSQSGK